MPGPPSRENTNKMPGAAAAALPTQALREGRERGRCPSHSRSLFPTGLHPSGGSPWPWPHPQPRNVLAPMAVVAPIGRGRETWHRHGGGTGPQDQPRHQPRVSLLTPLGPGLFLCAMAGTELGFWTLPRVLPSSPDLLRKGTETFTYGADSHGPEAELSNPPVQFLPLFL